MNERVVDRDGTHELLETPDGGCRLRPRRTPRRKRKRKRNQSSGLSWTRAEVLTALLFKLDVPDLSDRDVARELDRLFRTARSWRAVNGVVAPLRSAADLSVLESSKKLSLSRILSLEPGDLPVDRAEHPLILAGVRHVPTPALLRLRALRSPVADAEVRRRESTGESGPPAPEPGDPPAGRGSERGRNLSSGARWTRPELTAALVLYLDLEIRDHARGCALLRRLGFETGRTRRALSAVLHLLCGLSVRREKRGHYAELLGVRPEDLPLNRARLRGRLREFGLGERTLVDLRELGSALAREELAGRPERDLPLPPPPPEDRPEFSSPGPAASPPRVKVLRDAASRLDVPELLRHASALPGFEHAEIRVSGVTYCVSR